MLISLLMAASVTASGAAGACPASPTERAAAMELGAAGAQASNTQMLMSAALLLQSGKADAAHAREAAEPCRIGAFQAAGTEWELTAGDRAYVRRAVSADAARPIAFLYPVADMMALLAAAKNHSAPPPTRYVLVTSSGSVSTVWRAYENLPSDAQFMSDLKDALTRRISPAGSVDMQTNKVSIFVPEKRR